MEIRAEIPAEQLEKYRAAALKEIQKTAKLDGFRAGHAPIERIVQVYGESAILKQAAERAVQNELPELLAAEKAMIVEAPRVTIDAPQQGKPLSFTARAPLAPQITLPDYKKIAEKHNASKEEVSVSDQEHTEAMTHLKRERARIDKMEAGADAKKAHEESRAMKDEELPALDDAFVQALGYESAEKFSDALRSNIKNEKEMQAREKRRAAMLDDLVKDAKISYPASLREYELDDMEARMKEDLSRMGTTFDAYLAQSKKTREEIRESWKDGADKRAKVRLVLAEIARKENIQPDEKALSHEIDHAKQHYPDVNPEALRAHIAHAMRNEATIRFLEGDTAPVGHTEHDHQH
jgi:FKBP-type peptidyl-prolyl cis-trans isomerase (trigger factor)